MLTGKALAWLLRVCGGLSLLLAQAAWAQDAELSFQRYTTEQGLSHNGVTALAKDRRGFLWVGTFNGLNRFDGVQFKVYRHTGRPDGLPSNYVLHNGLSTDPLGYLWVATTRGLYRFDPLREQGRPVPVPEPPSLEADSQLMSAVSFDRAGQGWFASGTRLYRINPRTLHLTSFPLPFSVPGDYPNVLVDAAGRLWLHFQQAAYRFDLATQQYTYYLGVDERHPQGLTLQGLAQDGTSLYALSSQGALRYEATTDRFVPCFSTQLALYAVAGVHPAGGEPVLWLGDLDRLTRYEPRRARYTHFLYSAVDSHSYPGDVTLALLADAPTGLLWVGTARGLAVLDPQANNFRRQLVASPDHHRYPEDVYLVQQDRADDSLYWVLTRQTGLWRWRGAHLAPVPALMASRLHGLQQDAQGRLWLGWANGLACYDPATGRWQQRGRATPASQLPIHIQSLYLDRQARLWVGASEQGLYWYDAPADCLRRYPLPTGAGGYQTVHGLQEDARGWLWVRTSHGLFRVAPDRRRVQLVPIRAAGTPVQPTAMLQSSFLLDHWQRLWLAGIGFVAQLDTTGRVRRTYTLANGLHADHTFGLATDPRGHLWLATDEQLHELDPATGRFQYYDQRSGLLVNTVYQGFTRNRQGYLFLGGVGGFNYFQPARLRRNLVPPPVAITGVRINNQPRPLAPAAAVELHPGETTLSVDFAALNFSQASKNRYAYQLQGFDPAWTTTSARTATYTNLAPGRYTLRIRAANNDGVWNLAGQSLAVQVYPAYYQTWFFKAGLLALGVAGLWGVASYRRAQRRQLARVRDRIAKDLHDDIGSTLSSIRIFSEVAQGQLAGAHPQTVALLQRISTNASTLAESMQDIIWTVKPSADGLPDVVSRMREFGLRLTEAKGIAFVMSVEEPFPALSLRVEQRRNLYLVFKESVNNAVKHAACARLTVRLRVQGRQLHLFIEDNGQGFDLAATSAGNGLANLHARAHDIGGHVRVASAPRAGTTVALTIPLG